MPLLQELVIIFFFFMGVIAVFGLIYARLFGSDPRHFVFSPAIVKRQREVAHQEFQTQLDRTRKARDLVLELKSAFLRGEVKVSAGSYKIALGTHTYDFVVVPPSGALPPMNLLNIFDLEHRVIAYNVCSRLAQTPENLLHFHALTNLHLQDLTEKYSRLEERLASIPTDLPQIWSFWDFLYFSVVVQTTMGLGDILPNSTQIRKLVMTQTLLGYAILIVVLNVVLANR